MKMSYTDEQRLFLIDLDFSEIMSFITEIPIEAIEMVLKHLPIKVNGFRKNTRQYIERKIQLYLHRRSHWKELEWDVFAQLWVQWTIHHDNIMKIIGCSKVDDIEKVVEEMITHQDLMTQRLDELSDTEYSLSPSRQDLKKWFEFGPFNYDDTVAAYIERAPTNKFLHFVEKVDSMQQALKVVEEHMQQEFTQISSSQAEFLSTIDDLASTIQRITLSVEEIRASQRHLDKVYEGSTQAHASLKEHLKLELDERFQHLENDLSEFNNRMKNMPEIRYGEADSSGDDEEFSSVIQEDGVGRLFDICKISGEFDQADLVETVTLAQSRLKKSINSIGVQRSDAKLLSGIVLAAVGAGQLTTFAGSFSRVIAECCATSLAGDKVYIVKVPTGLLDFHEVWRAVDSIVEEHSSNDTSIALIFEGLNRSSCSARGNRLKELIEERVLGIAEGGLHSPYLFATLVEEPLGLPEKELFEMGPVIYTDALQWKRTPGFKQKSTRVATKVWSDLVESVNSVLQKPDEFDAELEDILPDWMMSRLSALSRRVIFTAFDYLTEIDNDNVDKAISYGWIFPVLANFYKTDFEQLRNEEYFDEEFRDSLNVFTDLVNKYG